MRVRGRRSHARVRTLWRLFLRRADYRQRFWAGAPAVLFERKTLVENRNATAATDNKRPLLAVIEDDAARQLLIRTIASTLGYGFAAYANANEGLTEKPDLILFDALLSRHDSRDIARRLKIDPATAASKVVVMSGRASDPEFRHDATARFKADDCLAKPLAAAEVIEVLKKYLPRAGTTARIMATFMTVKRVIALASVVAAAAFSASAQTRELNPTVKVLARPQSPVPAECATDLTTVPALEAEAPAPEPVTAAAPPSNDLRASLRPSASCRRGRRLRGVQIGAGGSAARRRVASAGGERNAANEALQVFTDIGRVWDYAMTSPTGSFFDSTVQSGSLLNALKRYPEYGRAIADQTVAAGGKTLYPTPETRRFLARESARRLTRLGVSTPAHVARGSQPEPLPRRVVTAPPPEKKPVQVQRNRRQRRQPKTPTTKTAAKTAPKKTEAKPAVKTRPKQRRRRRRKSRSKPLRCRSRNRPRRRR